MVSAIPINRILFVNISACFLQAQIPLTNKLSVDIVDASYHGRFTGSDDFITLFTNSVFWLWNNEDKYEESMQRATQYFAQQNEELQGALQRGKDLEKKAESGRTLRTILILVFAGVGMVTAYWATFLR